MELSDYRHPPQMRGYEIDHFKGTQAPWRIYFYVDGEKTGQGQYQTREQAENAGTEYMFSGWGDAPNPAPYHGNVVL